MGDSEFTVFIRKEKVRIKLQNIYTLKKAFSYCLLLLLSFLASCERGPAEESTTTQGTVTLAVDDAFLPIMRQEKDAFEHHYPKAKVNMISIKEGSSILVLLKDSVKLAISSRKITEQERTVFESKKINLRQYLLAHDAVAILVSKNTRDTVIDMKNFSDIINGIDQRPLVFEDGNNANLIFIKNKLGIKEFGKNVFSLASIQEIVDYISVHPDAMGLVGAAWINDIDAQENRSLLKNVNVVGIRKDNHVYYPFQEDLYEHRYPLTRDIYVLSSETGSYTGTGFVSFILSDIGQRVVLKAGLLPATSPGREILIKKKKKQ